MMRSLRGLGGLTRVGDIDENTRNQWVATLHSFTEVKERMRSVTNTSRQSSEQHKELGRSRFQRDYEDLLKFHDWLKQFNPFDVQDKILRSLDSGLVAKEGDAINCHNAEEVGRGMQEEIDCKCFTDATIKTSKKMKTLLSLTKGIEVGNQIIYVNPLILFMRLIVLVERSENTVNYFAYELTPFPTLFQDNFMRHPDKSDLMHALLSYNSEITRKKRKINESTNSQCNSKVRKIRKTRK